MSSPQPFTFPDELATDILKFKQQVDLKIYELTRELKKLGYGKDDNIISYLKHAGLYVQWLWDDVREGVGPKALTEGGNDE